MVAKSTPKLPLPSPDVTMTCEFVHVNHRIGRSGALYLLHMSKYYWAALHGIIAIITLRAWCIYSETVGLN